MASHKQQVKIRLQPDVVERLHKLHPSYGEAGRVVQRLVRDYVEQEERRRGKTTAV